MLFSNGRDGLPPAGSALARSPSRSGADHPGAVRRRVLLALLAINLGQPVGLLTLTSVAIICSTCRTWR